MFKNKGHQHLTNAHKVVLLLSFWLPCCSRVTESSMLLDRRLINRFTVSCSTLKHLENYHRKSIMWSEEISVEHSTSYLNWSAETKINQDDLLWFGFVIRCKFRQDFKLTLCVATNFQLKYMLFAFLFFFLLFLFIVRFLYTIIFQWKYQRHIPCILVWHRTLFKSIAVMYNDFPMYRSISEYDTA